MALVNQNKAAYYKTAALPTELIRQAAVFLGFWWVRVNSERAKRAEGV
jgi:hypothetical protein